MASDQPSRITLPEQVYPHNTNWLQSAVINLPDEMKRLYGSNLGIRVALHHQEAPCRNLLLELAVDMLNSRSSDPETGGKEWRPRYTPSSPRPPVASVYLIGRNNSRLPGQYFHLGKVVLGQKPLGQSYNRDEVLARVQPKLAGLLKEAFPKYSARVLAATAL